MIWTIKFCFAEKKISVESNSDYYDLPHMKTCALYLVFFLASMSKAPIYANQKNANALLLLFDTRRIQRLRMLESDDNLVGLSALQMYYNSTHQVCLIVILLSKLAVWKEID